MTAVLAATLAALVVAGFALYVYRARELPISGRMPLALLRAATLVGVVLLLADPMLPFGGVEGPPEEWVVVDGSASMAVAASGGATPWARVGGEVAPGSADVPLAVMGTPGADTLPSEPTGGESRLAPTLRRAAEAGARRVTVFTDLRIADAPAVRGLVEALDLEVAVVDVGAEVRSAGIARVGAPETGRAGESVEIEVELFGTPPTEGESVSVRLLGDGEVIDERTVRLPGAGRSLSVVVPVELPDSAGPVLWQARVSLSDDAFPRDDVRSAFTEVDPLEGLLALVSLTPDWEPRFLLPVLGRVTGLPTRGWFRVGDDRYLPMDGSGGVASEADLQRVAEDARMLVVHGMGGDAPEWLVRAQNASRRALIFADDVEGAGAAGVTARPAEGGEWYASAASGSLGAVFTGLEWADLAPLSSPFPTDSATWRGLELERPGGARASALALQDRGDRRRAVVLARGFWRWGFRPGVGADAYDRLWSGVAGWLLGLEDDRAGGGLGPADRVSEAGREVEWRVPVAASGTIEVSSGIEGEESRVDTVEVTPEGRAALPPFEPGSYAWSARVLEPDSLAARDRVWGGRLEVEAHTDELRWPRDTTLVALGDAASPLSRAGGGRPLRTSPWPYLVLLSLLSAEWILRRRSGLR